jgi:hypothetical protein
VVSLGGNWNQFDVHEGEARRHKGQFAIEIDSPEAAVLVSTLEAGLNKTGALGWVNLIRQDCDRPNVSRWAVTKFCERLKEQQVMKRLKRGTKKSGTLDETSLWARARLSFAQQLLNRLKDGNITLEAIIFLDEHHEKCTLGLISDIETLIARTPDGKIAPESCVAGVSEQPTDCGRHICLPTRAGGCRRQRWQGS